MVGYGKEVIVGPEKASVVIRVYSYGDVHQQAAIVTVPDLNGIPESDCRDPIALWRILGCCHPLPAVVECLHFLASCNVQDAG